MIDNCRRGRIRAVLIYIITRPLPLYTVPTAYTYIIYNIILYETGVFGLVSPTSVTVGGSEPVARAKSCSRGRRLYLRTAGRTDGGMLDYRRLSNSWSMCIIIILVVYYILDGFRSVEITRGRWWRARGFWGS